MQDAIREGKSEPLFPPLSMVAQAAWSMIHSGELLNDAMASILRAIPGFALGALLGIILGVLTGRVATARMTLAQVIQLLRPIPAIAVVPLAVIWLGIGYLAKFTLVAFASFFPIWLATHLGIMRVQREYVWAARVMGIRGIRMVTDILLPATTGNILAGLRIGIGLSFYSLIAAEIAGASSGLAFRISASHLTFQADKMIVAIGGLGVLGALADFLFSKAAGFFIRWQHLGALDDG